MNPKSFLFFFCCLCAPFSWGQTEVLDHSEFTVEELQEDFNFWRNELQLNHPVLYQYNTKVEFDAYFDSLYGEIKAPMSRTEFFRLIAPASLFVKCVHAQIQPATVMSDSIMAIPNMIPFDLRWYEGKAYVSYNFTGEKALSEGVEVLNINGVSTDEMYSKFLSLLPRDGYSMQYPKYWVNRLFYYYYHLWYEPSDEYTIFCKSYDNFWSMKVKGMSLAEMDVILDANEIGLKKEEGIELNFVDSLNTAYLQIGSFTESDIKRENGAKSKKILKQCFARIDSAIVDHLIIDLQENGGGSPTFALDLCLYFMNEEFVFKQEFRKVKDPDEWEFDKRSKKTLLKDKTVGVQKPRKDAFKGKVYLLLDGGSCSASGEVASVIERYDRGVIIGEESGGSPYLLSSKWFYIGKYELPNTKLKYSAPYRTSIFADVKGDTGYGTIPKYLVSPTIETYLAEEDLALIKALELISASKDK